MAVQFTGRESIPAVVKEMALEEKILFCNGGFCKKEFEYRVFKDKI